MNSADAFLDEETKAPEMPSADAFLDGDKPLSSSNIVGQIIKPSLYATGVIMKAFGNDNVPKPDLGLDKETVDAMKSSGEWNDYVKDHTDFHTALSDGVLRPNASNLQAAFIRNSAAPFLPIAKGIPSGIEAGWQNIKNFATMADLPTPVLDEIKTKVQSGQPVDWKDYLGAFNEGFTNSPAGQAMGAIFNPTTGAVQPAFNEASKLLEKAGVPHQVTEAVLNLSPLFGVAYSALRGEPAPQFAANEGPWGSLQSTLNEAQAADVIGEGIGEGQYMGTVGKTPEQAQAAIRAAWQLPEEYQPPSIHEIARNIAPETFNEYDALARTKENALYSINNPDEVFGAVIDRQISGLKSQAAELSKAPIGLEGEELETAVQENIAKAQPIDEQIRQLQNMRTQFIKDSTEEARQAMQEADYRMRDLAPKVSEAYRDAQGRNIERFPAIEPEESQVEENALTPPIKPAATTKIADDVSQKLVAAGRPQEEASAAAQLVQAHYEARADRFDGKLGTPEEMYERDGAEIKAGKGKVRARVLAQNEELGQGAQGKIRLATDDAKATITLMKSANASTFIHETGHHWLDEMMRDATDDAAPEDLKADAATVRKWLGVDEGDDIPTRAHEKFARGFERYLMEGTAPTHGLAGVFAQFKSWLTAIYQTVEKLRSPITPDIRDVFDRLLTNNPEKIVIAPEQEPGKMLASIHEADAQTTPPERAASVASVIRTEIDHIAKLHEPEIADAIKEAESRAGQPTEAIGSTGAVSGNAEDGNESGATTRNKGATQEPEPVSASGNKSEAASTTVRAIPESPNARFSTESKYLDKAGNIRLDLLNTPEDIKQVLRDTAEENNDFLPERRGVISNGQALDLADALGTDAAMLDMRQIGKAYNAEEIVRLTKMLIQSASDVRDKMDSGDVDAYLEAKARHQMIQGQVAGATAEAGRALQIFQALKKIEGYDQAKAVSDFLEQTEKGKTLFQIQQEMDFGKNLTTPEQVSKFIMDSSRHSFRSMILEYYVNSLISGPITHLRYAAGNTIKALWTPLVETPISATIGELREMVGNEGERVYYGESLAQMHGLMEGASKGWDAAVKAFQEGYSEPLPTERTSPQFLDNMSADYAIPGKFGEYLNLPSRSVAAIHSFFKVLRYEQNIQGLAYRTAMEEGLGGDAFSDRIADLTVSPTSDMMTEATKGSLKQLYMAPTDYNSLTGILTRATNKFLLAKIIVPFMKIGGQITREAFIESTPLGFFDKDVNANLMGENGAIPRDMQIGRITAGTALIGTTVMLAAKGLATGDGPDDPSQRRVWLLTHKPNSLQIGDISIPYQGLGSLGMLMRFAANMTETASHWDKEAGDKLAVSFVKGISKSVLDENFMRGVNDALQAAYHPEEYGANYIKSFATNWLPFSVGLGQTAREIDPYHREAKTIFEAARAKIPVVSEGLFPQRDIFGLPIPNGKPFTDYKDDPVVQRMNALNIGVGKLENKIRGVQLSEKQYDDYSRISGNLVKERLDKLVAGQKFTSLPEAVQIDMIHKTISDMREMARQIVMKQNPELINQAAAAKRIKKGIQ